MREDWEAIMVSVLETGQTRYCSTAGSDPLRQSSSLIWALSLIPNNHHHWTNERMDEWTNERARIEQTKINKYKQKWIESWCWPSVTWPHYTIFILFFRLKYMSNGRLLETLTIVALSTPGLSSNLFKLGGLVSCIRLLVDPVRCSIHAVYTGVYYIVT